MGLDIQPRKRGMLSEDDTIHGELDALIGQTLVERFRIDALLGRGGMGAVYRGHHLGLRRDVAIKVLHPELVSNKAQVRRFEREAQTASRLDHVNCVRVMDFGVTPEGLSFIVMDLLVGTDLKLQLGTPWAPERAVAHALQIARGLAHAHGRGLVHRDLKPENVIVTEVDGADLIKIVDFGIAKVLSGDGVDESLTRTGLVFGTPRYMSPEQASGGKLDERADLYALGLIMFEMLTGRAPFEADDSTVLLRKHILEAPPPLPEAVPAALADLVQRLLGKLRDERPASAQAVADELAGMSPVASLSRGTGAVALGPPVNAPTAPSGVMPVPSPIMSGQAPVMPTAAPMAHVSGAHSATSPTLAEPVAIGEPYGSAQNPALLPMVLTFVGLVVLLGMTVAWILTSTA